MKLVYYPDPSLLTACEEVRSFDKELHDILDQMKSVMIQSNGMGLSANQVAINKKMFIMLSEAEEVIEFINPKLKDPIGESKLKEGCLSLPGVYEIIPGRPDSVIVEAQDRNGDPIVISLDGIEAVCAAHEMEHLEGKFYLDNLSRQVRKSLLKQHSKK